VRLITGRIRLALLVLALLNTITAGAAPYELTLSVGGGPQPGGESTDQINRTSGIDLSFWRWERSHRQHLLLGLSITRITTDAAAFDEIRAISIYPQLNLYPERRPWGQPFFFVRALGPSFISSNRLGTRRQANHFAFQAQVGVGAYLQNSGGSETIISVAWKHFSNAGLFDDNDGIDMPVVLNIGVRF
jgi:lipid A 3-O-deacylase